MFMLLFIFIFKILSSSENKKDDVAMVIVVRSENPYSKKMCLRALEKYVVDKLYETSLKNFKINYQKKETKNFYCNSYIKECTFGEIEKYLIFFYNQIFKKEIHKNKISELKYFIRTELEFKINILKQSELYYEKNVNKDLFYKLQNKGKHLDFSEFNKLKNLLVIFSNYLAMHKKYDYNKFCDYVYCNFHAKYIMNVLKQASLDVKLDESNFMIHMNNFEERHKMEFIMKMFMEIKDKIFNINKKNVILFFNLSLVVPLKISEGMPKYIFRNDIKFEEFIINDLVVKEYKKLNKKFCIRFFVCMPISLEALKNNFLNLLEENKILLTSEQKKFAFDFFSYQFKIFTKTCHMLSKDKIYVSENGKKVLFEVDQELLNFVN
ncbi:hypothetical protein GVAV_003540 [Gurleya vavrai]